MLCVGLPACGPAVAVCGCAITYLGPARRQAVPSLQLPQTALSNYLHVCTLESQHKYLLDTFLEVQKLDHQMCMYILI